MKKYTIVCLCAAMLLSTVTHSAVANSDQQAAMQKAAEVRFDAIDTSANDMISIEEFKVFYPQMKDTVFSIIDENQDAGIDLKEWIKFSEEHMRSMKGSGGGMGGERKPGMNMGDGNPPGMNHPGGNMLIMPPPGQ